MRKKIMSFLGLVGIMTILVSSAVAQPTTPRNETLIVDSLDGRIINPYQFNPYMPGTNMNQGTHQLMWDHLWDINTVTGKWVNSLAIESPELLSKDYTRWRIRLRQGIYWSDGVEFTADDVAFTLGMLTTNKDLPAYGYWSEFVEEAKVVDKYTVDVQLKKPYAKFQSTLGVVVWGCGFYPVPKHIWQDKDPAKFTNYPFVDLGPYILKDINPNGYWFLYERRQDWQRTSVGQLYGMPKPRYVLFKFYGPEEKRIMAGIQHKLDIFCDITPEAWEILRQKNEYAKAWYDSFPWADMDDPCERGIAFNCSEYPYNLKEVRWALALATDIEKVSLGTFAGMLRFSPLQVPPISVFKHIYFEALEPWLREFELPDGYKPFDPDVGVRMAEYLRNKGQEGIPADEKGMKDIFGIGWWKYDPTKAAKLLEGVGFKKGSDGKWILPDGKPWSMTIVCPSNFELQSQRLAFAVSDRWRKFGIDVNVQPMEGGTFWTTWPMGTFQAGSYWPGCGQIPDIWDNVNAWHEKYITPTGKPAPSNPPRLKSSKISELADKLGKLLPTDPKCVELGKEALKAFVEEMPWIPMVGTSKFVPTDTYYWKGYPRADNHYEGPWWWWSNFKFMLPFIEPTGRK